MRSALAALFLAGCSMAGPGVPTDSPGSGRACAPPGPGQFIGERGTSDAGAAILRATGATTLRWAPPGVMLTMDFSPSRVTVRLGPDGKITEIVCG